MPEQPTKPLLIYDGDCSFCQYWVDYWYKLTGDGVNYQPYQKVGKYFPSVSEKEFQQAVQYVAADNTISSAAKASFLTLGHAKGGSKWMKLYQYLPGFAFISEQAYSFISSHRNFMHKLSVFFWGRKPQPPTYDLLTWIFLRFFGLLFLSAFYSFATQALGLIGSHGIVPIATYMTNAKAILGPYGFFEIPVLFWFNSSDFVIQLIAWSGVAISVLLILNILPRLSLLLLYILYLSLMFGGQVFMTFQWDMLLLETALIAIVLVRYRTLGIWLLRWLVFRYIFCSGLVKIFSGDPSWWDFTALNYHFLTQPLPTPLAWYAYNLPEVVLKSLSAGTLMVELFIPFLIFFPRRLRFMAGYCILAMQIGILLTGNYNFFNLTTIMLCLSLFDDAALKSWLPVWITKHCQQKPFKSPSFMLTPYLVASFTVITILLSFAEFNQRFIGYAPLAMTRLTQIVAPFVAVNTYGPFAVMTKTRYEINIEGSDDGVHWQEYKFKYKPDDLNKPLSFNIPFQPRLDWQMWFAALGPPQASPWFSSFLQRLLENSPTVTALLAHNPFPDLPPVFVRAIFYKYTFTNMDEYRQTGNGWKREWVGVYFPAVHLS